MNGAIALPWASTSSMPTTRITNTIGIIHQSFRCQRNAKISPATLNRSPARFKACITPPPSGGSGFPDDPVVQDQEIHSRTRERAQGVGRGRHDRLSFQVEGGVQHDRDARQLAERLDETVVPGIELTVDGLQPGAAVHVGDRGKLVARAVLDGPTYSLKPAG